MKKKLKYFMMMLFFMFGLMFIGTNVKAINLGIYNGSNVGRTPPEGDCSEAYKHGYFCTAQVRHGVRLSVIYYDGMSYDTIGQSIDVFTTNAWAANGVYYFDQSSNNKISGRNGIGAARQITPGGSYIYAIIPNQSIYQNASGFWSNLFLKEVYDKDGNIDENSDAYKLIYSMTGKSLTNNADWPEPTEAADPNNGFNKIGYRIFIEPVTVYYTENGNQYILTPTEFAYLAQRVSPVTTSQQLDYYVSENEFMYTDFDDVGIKRPVSSCKSSFCSPSDVEFSGTGSLGHALHIIDMYNLLANKCDYKTGKGFPKGKKQGDKLTKQEQECCEDQVKKIQEKYKLAESTPTQCMLVSNSIPSFVNCMNIYFQGTATAKKKWEDEKKELLEFNKKYPACSTDGCEYAELVKIENTYTSCIKSMDTVTWLNSILLCKETKCEINYKSALVKYKGKHKLCDTSEWEKKVYTNNCKVLTSGCDENNPNHFPKVGDKNPDKTCCIYFEEKMKKEYAAQGLTQSQIDKKINDWFNAKDFRKNCVISKCDINATTLTPECCDELKAKYPGKSESFWKGKGCGISNNKCTWYDYADELTEHLKEMMGANCAMGSSNSITASDTKNWDCIFDSDNIKQGSKEQVFRDYYLKYSNPYCAVYCREDVKYDFPKGTMVVKAGSHFTVGDTGIEPSWSSIQFSSTRECKTSGSTKDNASTRINTDKFKKDWEAANKKVAETWDRWKIAEIYNILVSEAQPQNSSVRNCDRPILYYEMKCKLVINKKTGPNGEWVCNEKPVYGEYQGFYRYPGSHSYVGNYVSQNVSPGRFCSTRSPGRLEPAEAYYAAVRALETIEDDILACTSWDEFDHYRHVGLNSSDVKAKRYAKYPSYNAFYEYKEFNPDLTIDYDEPTYNAYDYRDLLKKHITSTIQTNDNFSTTGAAYRNKYLCGESYGKFPVKCKPKDTFEYSPQKEAHSTYYKEINYTLKDGVFSTILKPQGTAVNGSVAGSSSSQIYINLGYSALHVHFMTPTGVYDIGLTYPGFTPGTNSGKFEHNFDKLVDDKYKYDCTYVVHNEIIENDDPKCVGDNCIPICSGDKCTACSGDNCSATSLKGLNLIYRPISLGNPFPGINGTGRTPGSNWNSNSLIKNYITNNRGVKGTSVYTKAPMYQITLTPALIGKIRKYNETTTYNDFNMDCNSNGKECKSNFIRGNLGNSTYDFKNYFKTCTLTGNRGSTTCCGIGNWNDCDNKDGIRR